MQKYFLTCGLSLVTLASFSSHARATNYAVQNGLLGLSTTLEASANYGQGVTFGDIDTGITKQWIGFGSQYNTTLAPGSTNINIGSSAQCLNGTCSSAFPTDQNGHGTFTAGEIVGGLTSISLQGVAPAGNLIAVQVLNASGSGSSNDVANGITYAVNQGAEVLNLSLGPSGTAAQQAGFYQSIASAVNYAASKGAIVVFAGGNSAQAFSNGGNITGFTNAALSHILFVGSTNASESLSSFSNKPGSGYFVSTTGQHVAYDSLWLMADGENIWGASNYSTAAYGYGYITQMSGTSMAAPQATGAAGLLIARWPFLVNSGTATRILTATATDLGAKGVDTTYGTGFLNIAQAFQPVGALTIPVNGKMVGATGATVVASGVLGNLGSVSATLSRAVGYDSFSRDFPINVQTSILTKASTTAVSTATAKVSLQSAAASRIFAEGPNGSWFAFSGNTSAIQPGMTEAMASIAQAENSGDPTRPAQADWSFGFQQQDGTYTGFGQGSTASLSFNDARWEGASAFFNSEDAMGGTLLGLADNASYATFGMNIDPDDRLSVGTMNTSDSDLALLTGDPVSANGLAVAYTYKVDDKAQISWTASTLSEKNMLLGSPSSGYLDLGSANTNSVGFGGSRDMGEGYTLGFDTILASTTVTNSHDSLISDTSRLTSAGFSVVLGKSNLFEDGDQAGLTFKKPLRVYGGDTTVNVPVGTDLNGQPIVQQSRAALAPTGNESDVGIDYKSTLPFGISSTLNMLYRQDADNVAGVRDAAVMEHISFKF